MNRLANFGAGRVLLHMLAMLGSRSVRFHLAGISREAGGVLAVIVMSACFALVLASTACPKDDVICFFRSSR
jgi:hypothetical protein